MVCFFNVFAVILLVAPQLQCIHTNKSMFYASTRYYFALSIDTIHVTIIVSVAMRTKIEKWENMDGNGDFQPAQAAGSQKKLEKGNVANSGSHESVQYQIQSVCMPDQFLIHMSIIWICVMSHVCLADRPCYMAKALTLDITRKLLNKIVSNVPCL